MDDFFAAVAIIGTVVLSGYIGSALTNSSWRADCEKLGRTVSYGQVYECRKVEPPKEKV